MKQGPRTKGRRLANIRAFVAGMERRPGRRGQPVRVDVLFDDAADYLEHPWIARLREFALFLESVDRKLKSTILPVKIGILDDGVTVHLDMFKDKIASGQSFAAPQARGATGATGAWYSAGEYGTQMADLIHRICLPCRLYVARLDESPRQPNVARQIPVRSAAKAIRWAVDMGVDIICMVWTVEAAEHHSDAKDLEDALASAADANVVMFCSANDGNIPAEKCYPRGEKIIRIGAATDSGDPCPWVQDYHFLLPGDNIPFKSTPQTHATGSASHGSGSALATALASGLGGILLYCERLVGQEEESFKSGDRMFEAFHRMSRLNQSKFTQADIAISKRLHDELLQLPTRKATSRDLPNETPLSKMPCGSDALDVLRHIINELKAIIPNTPSPAVRIQAAQSALLTLCWTGHLSVRSLPPFSRLRSLYHVFLVTRSYSVFWENNYEGLNR